MKTILTILTLLFLSISVDAQLLRDCSTCSTQIIQSENIKDLSIDELQLLTNEIYARNGYQFETHRLQYFFSEKSWYNTVEDNKKVTFNEIEKKNIKFLQEQTKLLKNQREEIIKQLKKFKTLVLNNKINDLKLNYNFAYENTHEKEESNLLKEVLNKIDLENINYYKNNGLYSVTIDNGFVQILYQVSLEKGKIDIYYNYMTNSSIIDNLDEFTEYHSENEYMYNWQFEFTNNKITYIRLDVAG